MLLRHYTWIILRKFWLIFLVVIICSGATLAVSKLVKPVYQAVALMQVNGVGATESNTNVINNQALAADYALQITDTTILQAASQNITGVSPQDLVQAVSASPENGSAIISVRAQASDPQQAAKIANAVVTTFTQIQVADAVGVLQTQLNQSNTDLSNTQTDITTNLDKLATMQKTGASAEAIALQKNLIANEQAHYNTLFVDNPKLQQQVKLASITAAHNLEVIQWAALPDKPSSPQTSLDTIIAAVLSLLLMIVLLLTLDWLDSTLKTPEDVFNLAAMEPLGSVPLSKNPLLLSNSPDITRDSAIEESFIVLATCFNVISKGQHVVSVTSPRTGAGKTTVASNLAITLAVSGTRVLLVDANLRQPALHAIFHRTNAQGWNTNLRDVHLLQERAVLSWLMQWATEIPNLWLLPTGPVSPGSNVLWHMPEWQALLRLLLQPGLTNSFTGMQSAVDIIIFDAPALEDGTDALALSPIIDGTLLVVEAGKTQVEHLMKTRATLHQLRSPILGVVVNRQTNKHRPYIYVDRYRRDDTLIGRTQLNAAQPVNFELLTTGKFSTARPLPHPSTRSNQSHVTVEAMKETSYPSSPTASMKSTLLRAPIQQSALTNGRGHHSDRA